MPRASVLHGSDRIGLASEATLHGSDRIGLASEGKRSTVPTVGLASEAALQVLTSWLFHLDPAGFTGDLDRLIVHCLGRDRRDHQSAGNGRFRFIGNFRVSGVGR